MGADDGGRNGPAEPGFEPSHGYVLIVAAAAATASLTHTPVMSATKMDSPRVSLKLVFKEDVPVGGLLFTFTSANKIADRQAVQDLLIPFVSANRASGSGSPAVSVPASVAATPAASTPGTPSSVAKGKRKADALDPEAKSRTYDLRKSLLKKNSTLSHLHRQLVIGKLISEEEFWEGREAILRAEELAESQRPGRPSRLLDDRFVSAPKDPKKIQGGTGRGLKKVESGPVTFNLTKELIREIFEEFPVVQDAYAKHVPRILDTDFWARYFSSRLWEQHRASERKTAADEGTRKKDDIFDLYLEDPDWGGFVGDGQS